MDTTRSALASVGIDIGKEIKIVFRRKIKRLALRGRSQSTDHCVTYVNRWAELQHAGGQTWTPPGPLQPLVRGSSSKTI
jgi:hypothetical protein